MEIIWDLEEISRSAASDAFSSVRSDVISTRQLRAPKRGLGCVLTADGLGFVLTDPYSSTVNCNTIIRIVDD